MATRPAAAAALTTPVAGPKRSRNTASRATGESGGGAKRVRDEQPLGVVGPDGRGVAAPSLLMKVAVDRCKTR